jgi:NAD(P)-dependent dehydrogenase (short-subunit alcohol dehydrogenase family)
VKSVLITGSSSGIGKATALHLDGRGWRVFAGVRREEDAEALRAAASERLTPVMLDITELDQIAAAGELIAAEVGDDGLDGLVNNAGIGVVGPLETLPIDSFQYQLAIGLTGPIALTQAVLPQIRQAGGRIVFISSAGGFIARPFLGAYSITKFGLEAVADVFRRELQPWGISVSVVQPGATDTPTFERGHREFDTLAERAGGGHEELYGERIATQREFARKVASRAFPPEKVAAAIERALTARRPRIRYQVGRDVRVQALGKRLLSDRAMDRALVRAMRV